MISNYTSSSTTRGMWLSQEQDRPCRSKTRILLLTWCRLLSNNQSHRIKTLLIKTISARMRTRLQPKHGRQCPFKRAKLSSSSHQSVVKTILSQPSSTSTVPRSSSSRSTSKCLTSACSLNLRHLTLMSWGILNWWSVDLEKTACTSVMSCLETSRIAIGSISKSDKRMTLSRSKESFLWTNCRQTSFPQIFGNKLRTSMTRQMASVCPQILLNRSKTSIRCTKVSSKDVNSASRAT